MATIIFDLDGTLIDTTPLVIPAFLHALRQFPGTDLPTEDQIRKTFGVPDEDIWRQLMPHADDAQRRQAFSIAEERITKGMYTTPILLPHAQPVLKELHRRGHTLTTASNCGSAYMISALTSQGILPYFTEPLCLGNTKGRCKADILKVHVTRFARKSCVMVGDRSSDVEAAAAHNIPTIGCVFGFGDEHELADAFLRIHDLRELLDLFPADREGLTPAP